MFSSVARDGFRRAGIWNPFDLNVDAGAIENLFVRSITEILSLDVLLTAFGRRERSLLRDINVDKEDHIPTRRGASATNVATFDALKHRDKEGEKNQATCPNGTICHIARA